MDLKQSKLTKAEWNSIEIDVSRDEKFILDIITKGYHNIMICDNTNLSILSFLKIQPTDKIHKYVYIKYIADKFDRILKKYNIAFDKVTIKKKDTLKKADLFRFQNTDRLINHQTLFEFVLIELVETMLKYKHKNNKKWLESYYTLSFLMQYKITNVNLHVKAIITSILSTCEEDSQGNISYIIKHAQSIIEKNDYLLKYDDIKLYNHQKELFATYNAKTEEEYLLKEPTMSLYIAPTGTGKTLSPIGLSENYKIIYVCAARHVGLALARSAISQQKKIAFAFGCSDAEDIRLHYFAAKDYKRHWKSGQICKVDNSVGDKVEIMICDVRSYIIAMYYMLAFNKKEQIIMYWDEPTITLDYEDHEMHNIINETWKLNKIPNIILSSATLPKEEDIAETIMDYKSRFNGNVKSIISHDCKKTIPLINKEGYIEMPHYISADYAIVKEAAEHCLNYKTMLRYLDLGEVIKFIMYINKLDKAVKSRYKLSRNFETISDITMQNLKLYYLTLLQNISENKWAEIYNYFIANRTITYDSTIYITTRDSHTLTNGPTLFLANNITNIGQMCLQTAEIPKLVIDNISKTIAQNNLINEKIDELEKALELGTTHAEESVNSSGAGKTANMSRTTKLNKEKSNTTSMTSEMRNLTDKIQNARSFIKTVALHDLFIPNRRDHLNKWYANSECEMYKQAFTCNIAESIVEEIMLINDIEDSWKILLLMGIGVFASQQSSRYMEIMKKLADEQLLFVIIASSDYIYGTNYQFCHSYLSKDLNNISQEKCIQALGRIGRTKFQQTYSIRFRDNNMITKLFRNLSNDEKPEVRNMNRLFNT